MINYIGFVLIQGELLLSPVGHDIFELLLKHILLSGLGGNIHNGGLMLLGIQVDQALQGEMFVFDVEIFPDHILLDRHPVGISQRGISQCHHDRNRILELKHESFDFF